MATRGYIANNSRIARSTRAYMQRKLACVEQKRSHPPDAADLACLLAGMQSSDEHVRAQAVRQVCPCRLPWEVFRQARTAAKRLQNDPSPLVRANALHVEEDAREIAALEALREWIAEHDEGAQAVPHRWERRGGHRQSQGRWHEEGERTSFAGPR